MRWLLLIVLFTGACAPAPPTLSPVAQEAFNATRVIKALDVLRDTAIAANTQTPPLLSTATTRAIVMYHESALKIMHDVPAGWKPLVQTSLAEVAKDLPASEQHLLDPYFALVSTVLAEIP